MCGIAGLFHLTETGPVSADALERMIATMPHRGPDARGVKVVAPGAGMGHVRLSILDLRPESNQPFEIDDGDFVVTFNGEIYNYIELRDELERLGHHFRTRSDTEVLLVAYKQWGEAAVRRFNGMWAFAIYDRRRDLLFCSRDRFGVKPFSYAVHEGRFLFASEVKAMLAVAPGLARPNWAPISLLLRNHLGEQLEDTFFAGVKRLRPAHNLIVTRSGIELRRYWDYPQEPLDAIGMEEAAERVRDLLLDAIRLRLRSDVPVAMTLSGGVDSSAIACLLRTFHDAPFETYTAAYPGEPFDESAAAEKLALALHMKPHLVPALSGEFLPRLREIVHHLESATASPAVLPLWNIMRDMRRNVTVAIEGQGADELFGGYADMNFPHALADLLGRGRFGAALAAWRTQSHTWGWKSPLLWCVREVAPWTHEIFRRLRGDEKVYSGGLAEPAPVPPLPDDRPRFADHLTTALHRQHTGTLVGLLHYGDAISMAHSIESRLPFMDYRLVELGFRLPGALKVQDGYGKVALREAVRRDVPASILAPRRKLAFSTPVSRWLRDQPEVTAYPVLRSARCRERGIFDPKRLDEALARHVSGKVDLGEHIFRWIMTELWFQEFIDAG